MANSRLAALFIYTFGSVTLTVVLLAVLNQYAGQMLASWIENNIAVIILCCLSYGLTQVFIIFPIIGSWAIAVMPKSKVRLPVEDLRKRLIYTFDKIRSLIKTLEKHLIPGQKSRKQLKRTKSIGAITGSLHQAIIEI